MSRNALLAMADNERRADMAGAQNALTPHVVDWGVRNALELANAYQTPRNLLSALATAAYNAPGTIAGTAQSFLTGQPGGPQTKDEIYNAAGRSVNALGSAGLVAGPFAGRALQGVAATTKQASPFAVLPSAEVKSSPPQMFRPERARKIREQGLPEPRTIDTYHGTSDVPGVTREGFRPGTGGWVDGVFTTNNRDYADVFATSMDDADQPGVIATQNRGRYLPIESDPHLQQIYREKDTISRNDPRLKDLEAAGIDGLIVDDGKEVITFNSRRGTIFDRDGYQLFSDSRGAVPAAGITAYHGSPHDFDKFKMSQIGTGEGAQAYGHGLYFAESPGVARNYQDMLGGKGFSHIEHAAEHGLPATPNVASELYSASVHGADDAIKAASRVQMRIPELRDDGPFTDVGPKRQQIAKAIEDARQKLKGRLYEVNIKANKEDFLDWDRPLSEQSLSIQEAFGYKDGAGKFEGDPDDLEALVAWADKADLRTGEQVIRDLYKKSGSTWLDPNKLAEAEVAQRLKELGIPGIKYLDQGSRGKGGGTYNYVVFDEDLIEISKKMGLAVPIGPGFPGYQNMSEKDRRRLVAVPEKHMERIKAAAKLIESDTWDIY